MCKSVSAAVGCAGRVEVYDDASYWAIQQSWFARVNALCNLSRKKSREVAAHFWPISEYVLLHAVYNSGSWN